MTYLRHILSMVLLSLSLCGWGQTGDTSRHMDPIQDSAFQFAGKIFSRPNFLFETLQPEIPADMQPILIRMNNAIMENRDWFVEYRKKYGGAGEQLPYDEHFGISREEYRRVQHMESQPPQLVVADSQKVATQSDNGVIQFKSEGSTHLLDYLFVDIQHQILMYGGDTIPFQGRANSGTSNPYGQWQGYVWRLERADINASIETGKPTARVIEVDLGLPRRPGVAYIRIEYQDMKAGVTTANMELIGYIR